MLNVGLCSWVTFIEMGKVGQEIDMGENYAFCGGHVKT